MITIEASEEVLETNEVFEAGVVEILEPFDRENHKVQSLQGNILEYITLTVIGMSDIYMFYKQTPKLWHTCFLFSKQPCKSVTPWRQFWNF